jgi:hypothetical protein
MATVEAILTVEPVSRLASGDLEEVLSEIMRRIDRALLGLFADLPAVVTVDDVSVVNPPHVPFFPATFGATACADPTAIHEAIEKLREGTPLGGLLYDSAGRAFTAHVWTSFRRVREEDRKVSGVWTPEGTDE